MSILQEAHLVPLGGGEFKVVPQKPQPEVTPLQAAKMLSVSRPTIYRLLELGMLAHRRPSRGKILISTDSIRAHRLACEDPEFWSRQAGKPVPAPKAPTATAATRAPTRRSVRVS